jgi:hypothetical protein
LLTLGVSSLILATTSCGSETLTADEPPGGAGDSSGTGGAGGKGGGGGKGGTTGASGEDMGGADTTGSNGYCRACAYSSDCRLGFVCRQVSGPLGVCAKTTDTECCDGPDGTSGNCYTNLGGAPGSAGGGGKGGGAATGGSGGTGGTSAGHGGSSGRGGGGSGTGGVGGQSGVFGAACEQNSDCDASLVCLTNAALPGEMGPANGFCTVPCSVSSDCLELSNDSYCYALDGSNNYCIPGCLPGTEGVPKCQERPDVACSLIGLIPGATNCSTSDDCPTSQLCDSSSQVCGDIVTGCVPTCGGDYDCGPSRYCDYASGLCSTAMPSGLPLGSFCNPNATTDPCNGFCLAGSKAGEGECSALCVFNATYTGCGFDGSAPAQTACLYATRVSGTDTQLGDVGLCGTLCDCNADCQLTGDVCIDETGADHLILNLWGRNGYCRPLGTGETLNDTFQTCTGEGGTGGESSGGQGGA